MLVEQAMQVVKVGPGGFDPPGPGVSQYSVTDVLYAVLPDARRMFSWPYGRWRDLQSVARCQKRLKPRCVPRFREALWPRDLVPLRSPMETARTESISITHKGGVRYCSGLFPL